MTAQNEPYDAPAIRAFAYALTAWRVAAALNKTELGELLGYVPQLIGQIEACKNVPSPKIAGDLNTFFKTDQFGKLEQLIAETRHLVTPPPGFTQYAELERRANEIWTFQPLIIPGPYQTEGYAQAIMASLLPTAVLHDAVQVRMERKNLITGEDAAHSFLVLDEWVLKRIIGDTDTMREQLAHLLELETHPRTTIQILPHDTEHYVAYSGMITLLTLRHRQVAYIESGGHGNLVEGSHAVAELSVRYDLLRGHALSVPESRKMIRKAMEEL